MKPRTRKSLSDRVLSCLSVALTIAAGMTTAGAVQSTPASSWPALDAAAGALAEGRLDSASQQFETVSQDPSAPTFVRGLAMLALGEVALARRDFAAASATWRQLADDTALPRFHRHTARRRAAEAKRIEQGLPARDPAAYRVQLAAPPEPAVVFHVAPAGDDAADGSADRPFRTLERARDAARSLKQTHGGTLPKGGVRITIGGGSYPVQRTFNLTSEDSGTAEAPIIYQAKSGQRPIFHGGTRITAWNPISDGKLREKLDPAVRDRVLEADLEAAGITNWGDATGLRRRPELFVNGQPQTLARWPNKGFVKTGEILGKDTFKVWNRIEGCRDGKFRYLDDRPSRRLDVSNISRLKRTYTPAVHLDGCGNRIAHNLFERIPSSAMRVEGNDHLIELNVIRNIVQESDDQGGLDMWGNPLYRGVVIRWNCWSDIRGGTENGAAGVRLDDMICGVTILGNILERCGAVKFGGVQIHGGKENIVDGNLFVDCYAGISFSRWGLKRWLESIQRFLHQAGQPPYSSRYPELPDLKEGADENVISRNLFCRCESVFLRDGGVQQISLNATTGQALGPERILEGRPASNDPDLKQILFEKIPLEEMGPYEHVWRAQESLPPIRSLDSTVSACL